MSLILDGTNGLSDVDGSAATPALRGSDSNTGIFFPAADTIAFSEGGAEVMRIDSSGNVGIGSSPAATSRLQVSSTGSTRLLVENTTNSVQLRIQTLTATALIQTDTNHALTFATNNGAEAMRINAGAPILCLAGGSTTATGTGIAFPATQSASSDANTLDDYEEGTWTTTIPAAANITGTPTLSEARYTKVGRLVTLEGFFSAQTTSSNTNTYWTFTLPFVTAANSSGACGAAKQESNFIVGAVSDSTSSSNNIAYVSYSASAQLPAGTAAHSFSYTYASA